MLHKVLILTILSFSSVLLKSNDTDSLYKELEQAISQRDSVLKVKLRKIESIRSKLIYSNPKNKFYVFNELYNEYKSFKYDSAFEYARQLQKLSQYINDKRIINETRLKMGFTLLSAGMFNEALDTFRNINIHSLPDTSKQVYFGFMARTYFDMADFLADNHYFFLYNSIGLRYNDAALKYTGTKSYKYYSLNALRYLRLDSFEKACKVYEYMLSHFTLPQHQQSIELASLSYIYLNLGEFDLSEQCQIRSAIIDLKTNIKETTSLRDIAEKEYRKGDIQNAYKHIKVAMDDAFYYNARQRIVHISTILPIIEEENLKAVEKQKKKLFNYIVVISLSMLLIISFAVIIFYQFKKIRKTRSQLYKANDTLHITNNRLYEANRIKDVYIGNFFNTISDYITKIERFKKTISRKLSSKSNDDISDFINKIDLKQEREELFTNFDMVFLNLFPGFIESFNALMKEGEEIMIKQNDYLTSELRIFALMRLGITEGERIAQILNYSVNTIYTYKAKIKNKSKYPGDEFENKLMEIKPK